MKLRLTAFFTSLLFALTAQVPQAFNYQAVVRDHAGVPVSSRLVSFRVDIHLGSETGAVVYSETHRDSTNALGLISFPVGRGAVLSGVFSQINWSSSIYYMEILTDLGGGTTYQSSGAGELLSVPYALFAGKNAGIDVFDTVSHTRILLGEGELTNQLGTSRGIHCKLNNDSLEWGFQATYTAAAKSVMLYVYDTLTGANQIVQINPDNVAVRSRDGLGHESQLRIRADAGISIMTDTADTQYFLPAAPPTANNQVVTSEFKNNAWKTRWQDARCDTIFYPASGDLVNLVPNCYNIISPATPLASLILQLPFFARDGDVIEMKFEHTIGTLYYQGGTVSRGSLTTVDLSLPYQKFVFRNADGIWH